MKVIKKIGYVALVIVLVFICSLFTNNNVLADEIYEGDLLDVKVEEGNRDFRGVWVSALVNDVPRYQNQSQYKLAITKVLDNMEKYNFNTMVFHIRIYNDAFYKSEYCNYSTLYRSNPDWEALPWIIEECHKRGIEFHAWMNPYRVSTSVSQSAEQIAKKFPTSNAANNPLNLLIGNEFVILNPGIPEVQEFLLNVCMEVVEKYDIDAIHFDDYFYAAGVDDSYTYKKYGSEYTKLTDFRRASVTKFIESLHNALTEYNTVNDRAVKLGISPTAIYRCGNGEVTYDEEGHAITNGALMSTYFDQHYESACADTLLWIQKGYIDYIVPQLYVNGEQFLVMSTWWDKVVKNEKCNFVAGITENSCEWEHFKELDNTGGVCLFSYKAMTRLFNSAEATKYFADEALPNKSSYMDLPINYSPEIGVVGKDNGYEVVILNEDKRINYGIVYQGTKSDSLSNKLFKDENIVGYIDYNTSRSFTHSITKNDNIVYGVVLVSNDGSFSLGSATSVKNELYKITYKTSKGEVLKTEFLKPAAPLTYPEYTVEDGKTYSWSIDLKIAIQSMDIILNIVDTKYVITYVDPDGNILLTQEYDYGESLNLPDFPTSDKYTFKRWKVGGLYKVSGNDTIEASCDYIYYNVNFYLDDKLVESKKMHIDEEISYPKVTLDKGYEIEGWNDENYCTGEMDIYGYSKLKKFTVYFLDGENIIKEIEVDYNDSLNLNDIDIIKDGYSIKEFESNGKVVSELNAIKDNIYVNVIFEKVMPTYTVSFDVDGKVSTTDVKEGEKAVKPVDPVKEGYTFLGWYLGAEELETLYDFEAIVTADVTLVAKFEEVKEPTPEPVKYVVTFDVDGAKTTAEVKEGEKAVKPLDPVKEGYKFLGWYAGDELYDFEAAVTADVTLVAKFEEVKVPTVEPTPIVQYVVTFDVDGKKTTTKVNKGEKVSKPLDPVKDGYIFLGWYLDNNTYDFEATVTTDITLVAKFEQVNNNDTNKSGCNNNAYLFTLLLEITFAFGIVFIIKKRITK